MKEKAEWLQEVLSLEERKIIKKGGWGKQRGLGTHPCLMVIDAQYNYRGENAPILDQMQRWPSGCGAKAWNATTKIRKLLEVARSINCPVIYTRQVQKNRTVREGFDSFATKIERCSEDMVEGSKGTQIVEELSPQGQDLVVDKSYASAFYATPLIGFLIKMKIDTILVTGATTSGCVRSTVVDAAARNYNVGVVMDCVYDRIEYSHRASLLDMWMKYADILTSEETLAYFENSGSLEM